jgi:hypothetical protein
LKEQNRKKENSIFEKSSKPQLQKTEENCEEQEVFLSFGDKKQFRDSLKEQGQNARKTTKNILNNIKPRNQGRSHRERKELKEIGQLRQRTKKPQKFGNVEQKYFSHKKKAKVQSNMINLTKLFGLLKKTKRNKQFLIKAHTEQLNAKNVINHKNKSKNVLLKPEVKLKKLPKLNKLKKKKTENIENKQTKLLEHEPGTQETKPTEHKLKKLFTQQYQKQKKVQEAPVALFRSGDTHIKRFLKSLGVEVRNQGVRMNRFGISEDLKWVNQDRKSDYRRLRNCQLFNHFENIDELTTKTLLTRNLENQFQRSLFYPQTFSLSVKDERKSFKEEFYLRVSFKLLKNHVLYFEEKQFELVSKTRAFLDKKWKRFFAKKETNIYSKDTLFFDNYQSKHVDLTNGTKSKDFIVNTMLLSQMLYLWQSLARRLTKVEDQIRFFSPLKFDKEMWNRFQKYGDLELGYEHLDQKQRISIGIADEYWKTPSMSLVMILLDLDSLFRLKIKEYSEKSDHNLWIVKPSCNSKGTGIFISKCIKDIRKAWKNNVNRIIQKYVEDCLIIDSKKFDLRIWVLIESVNPLRVWVFEDYYARFCFDNFDLNQLDPTRHLTNFSVNKEKFEKNLHKSVMEKQVLISKLKS